MFNYEELPYTGGKYYEYIDEKAFAEASEFKDDYTLEDIEVGQKYTIYRMARSIPEGDRPDELVYLKLTGEVMQKEGNDIFFVHAPMKGKIMHLDQLGEFGEVWFFVPKYGE